MEPVTKYEKGQIKNDIQLLLYEYGTEVLFMESCQLQEMLIAEFSYRCPLYLLENLVGEPLN